MSCPVISIIIPVYNAEKYIERCIDSVINQSYKDWELILVDDGSEDHSFDICKTYEEKDDRIFLIAQENEGVSSARNKGISYASGGYVCFVDSDDFIEENMLKILYETMIEQHAELVVCGMKRISGRNGNTREYSIDEVNVCGKERVLEFVLEHFLEWLVSSPWGKLYKMSALPINGFDKNISLGEDLEFNIKYFENIDRISVVGNTLYCYFDTEHSLTKKYNKQHYKAICDIYALMKKYAEKIRKDYIKNKFYNVNYKFFTSCMSFAYQNIQEANYREERKFITTLCKNDDLQSAITQMKDSLRIDQKIQKFMLEKCWVTGIYCVCVIKYIVSLLVK